MSSGRDQRELTGLGAYDIEAASERAGGLTDYFDLHQERLAEGIVAVECRTEKSGKLKFRIVKCGALDSNDTWPSSLVAKCLPFEAANADGGTLVIDLDYFSTKYPASAATLPSPPRPLPPRPPDWRHRRRAPVAPSERAS